MSRLTPEVVIVMSVLYVITFISGAMYAVFHESPFAFLIMLIGLIPWFIMVLAGLME